MPAKKKPIEESLIEIIRKTAVELPEDVSRILNESAERETSDTKGAYAMEIIKANIDLAKDKSEPLCQDTSASLFFIECPRKYDEETFSKEIRKAVVRATRLGYLRQNSIDTLTGSASSNNLGPGMPFIHFRQSFRKDIAVRLILKGGGCENVGHQYSLPNAQLKCGQDMDGARKCILNSLKQIQSTGCGPGVLGVGLGGDRTSGYLLSNEQFLRKLTDINPITSLAHLERDVIDAANQMGIGPMGFGGKTALLACKVGAYNRLPNSYFVSVSYMCWTCRRHGAVLETRGKIKKWLY